MSKKNKQSLLSGALAGSFGFFLAKALGLFYVVPLNQYAGAENMAYYSITYTYYDIILKVTQAGIPFAIASLMARYISKEDYRSALQVKKVGTYFVLVVSFLIGIIFFFTSNSLAASSLGKLAKPEEVEALANLFKILLVAILSVPLLAVTRGYYQGIKRLDVYAISQVLEQLVRVAIIIFGGYFAVRVLKLPPVYAVYIAVLAAGIGAIFTLFYFLFSSRQDKDYLIQKASLQEGKSKYTKTILKEIFALSLPYVAVTVIGTTSLLINSRYFIPYITSLGTPMDLAKSVLGIVQTNCAKIGSIPQVLALGFSAGLVPYLSSEYERQDYIALRKNIKDILATVLYILIPIILVIIFFSKPIFFIMFGGSNLQLGDHLLRLYALHAFTDTVAPILSTILITLGFRKNALIFLSLSTVVKLISFFTLIKMFGYDGMILSTVVSSLFYIILVFILLKQNFDFDIKSIAGIALRCAIVSLVSILPFVLLAYIHPFRYDSRLLCMIAFGIYGIMMVLLYLFISQKNKLPQEVFNDQEFTWKKFIKRLH